MARTHSTPPTDTSTPSAHQQPTDERAPNCQLPGLPESRDHLGQSQRPLSHHARTPTGFQKDPITILSAFCSIVYYRLRTCYTNFVFVRWSSVIFGYLPTVTPVVIYFITFSPQALCRRRLLASSVLEKNTTALLLLPGH